eukprot:754094-Hanusia_phi.AAC.3
MQEVRTILLARCLRCMPACRRKTKGRRSGRWKERGYFPTRSCRLSKRQRMPIWMEMVVIDPSSASSARR